MSNRTETTNSAHPIPLRYEDEIELRDGKPGHAFMVPHPDGRLSGFWIEGGEGAYRAGDWVIESDADGRYALHRMTEDGYAEMPGRMAILRAECCELNGADAAVLIVGHGWKIDTP